MIYIEKDIIDTMKREGLNFDFSEISENNNVYAYISSLAKVGSKIGLLTDREGFIAGVIIGMRILELQYNKDMKREKGTL